MCGDISPYSIPSVEMHPDLCFARVELLPPCLATPSELRFRFGFRSASSPRTRDAGRNLNGRSSLRSIRPSARPTKHDYHADFAHSARRPAGVS